MKRLFRFRYPKIALFAFAIVISYFIFSNPAVAGYVNELGNLSYLGVFIAGILFAFGFTAPIATGFFITLGVSNLWLLAIIGGLGAVLGDLVICDILLALKGKASIAYYCNAWCFC